MSAKPIEAEILNLRPASSSSSSRPKLHKTASDIDESGPAEKFVDDTSKQIKGIAREFDKTRRAVGGLIDKLLELPDDGRGEPPER